MTIANESTSVQAGDGKARRLNYVSNLSLTEISGGWSGFNSAICRGMETRFEVAYVGPISPAVDQVMRVFSKARRSIGLTGAFPAFSERRLREIGRELRSAIALPNEFTLFHGSTSWIAYEPPAPYACFVDACFESYMSVYHDRHAFNVRDLKRICRLEAAWMSRARHVYFSSRWALEETVAAYGLSRDNLSVVGLGGNMPIPDSDAYSGGHDFLFVGLDFLAKGGQVCVDALRQLRTRFPGARLRIIGGEPPDATMREPGVSYEGFLDKARPEQLVALRDLFASAFALLLPTTRDATPLVIVEAAYFGCPTIATRAFGIPEMIVDGITGLLVDSPPVADAVAKAMNRMCDDAALYGAMRLEARRLATDKFTWARMTSLMADGISAAMA